MSEYTRAIFGTLEQGQADFVQTFNSLQETVSTLDSQLRGSLAEWIGSAQEAYYQAKVVWETAEADMANVLSQLGAVIGTAHANYTSAEAANTSLWA